MHTLPSGWLVNYLDYNCLSNRFALAYSRGEVLKPERINRVSVLDERFVEVVRLPLRNVLYTSGCILRQSLCVVDCIVKADRICREQRMYDVVSRSTLKRSRYDSNDFQFLNSFSSLDVHSELPVFLFHRKQRTICRWLCRPGQVELG